MIRHTRSIFLLGLFLLSLGVVFFTFSKHQSIFSSLAQFQKYFVSKNEISHDEKLLKKSQIQFVEEKFTPKFLPLRKGSYLGVFVSDPILPERGSWSGISNLRSFELNAKKEVSAAMVYQYWNGKNNLFDVNLAQDLLARGKILIISWNPSESITAGIDQPKYRLDIIARGDYDSYIRRWAEDIKNWGGPILLRFAPEMNGNWSPWGSRFNRPEEYVAAYQRVVNIFRETGAANVTWVWSPNSIHKTGEADPFYPGDEYVDWIGISGFNWGGLRPYQKWRTFEEVFGLSLMDFRKYHKPIILAEIGSVESPSDPTAKANWIADMFTKIKLQYPEIGMIVWANAISFNEFDWRIETSVLAQEAFQKNIQDSYFKSTIRANIKKPEAGSIFQ
ncbi:MAG: hypothetical protein HY776_01820 [Actinobacteria bacterium]|nr:hypothetical protein [Actinomycetota bacterium]